MQLPETLLADRTLLASAKAVLTALWRRVTDEPWVAPKVVDVAAAVGLTPRRVEQLLALLSARGAVRRESREVAGRKLLGFHLARSAAPLQTRPKRTSVTTAQTDKKAVAKRDQAHSLTLEDDMRAIAAVAGRGFSEVRIAQLLIAGNVPCSAGAWHNIKVRRRIELMRADAGITATGLRAGDVVDRWRRVAELQAKRAAPRKPVPDARIEFRDEDDEDQAEKPRARSGKP